MRKILYIYMLINIVGNVGAGKSLLAVILSLNFVQKYHLSLYSNLTFKSVDYTKLSIADLISHKITYAVVVIDEAYNYFHARNSMSNGNQMFGTVLFQSRKTDLILILTEQLQRSIDVYYRDLTDVTISCKNCVTYFEYDFLFHKHQLHYKMRLPFELANKFFRYYDTKEVISENNAKNKALMFTAMDSTQKEKYITELTGQIIDHYSDIKDAKKISKIDIKNYCITHDLKAFLSDLILAEIRTQYRK